MSSVLRTLEQERAREAWECVTECLKQAIEELEKAIERETDEKRRKDMEKRLQRLRTEEGERDWKSRYGSLVRKIPSYILTNGLGQTLAFLRAKGRGEPGSEHEVLYRHLSVCIKEHMGIDGDLLEWIVGQADSKEYRHATMETLAFLQWLKRFAEAYLPKGREE